MNKKEYGVQKTCNASIKHGFGNSLNGFLYFLYYINTMYVCQHWTKKSSNGLNTMLEAPESDQHQSETISRHKICVTKKRRKKDSENVHLLILRKAMNFRLQHKSFKK